MSIEIALQALFGADPDRIEISDLHHLACTLTTHHVELLLRAGGARWTKIIDRVEHKRAIAKEAKDPGEDPRFKADAKAGA